VEANVGKDFTKGESSVVFGVALALIDKGEEENLLSNSSIVFDG
jgi:hypothetical protein